MNTVNPTNEELARRWAARVRSGNFSAAVKGVGTIRIMGKTGDASVRFPRIESLAALNTLELDEQYAVRAAEAIVSEAEKQHRAVFSVQPGEDNQVVHVFDPLAVTLVVVAR